MATPIGFQKDDQGYWIVKDPNTVRDYTIDYANWLVNGDTIIGVNFDTDGLVQENAGIVPGGTRVFVELSGGDLGKNHSVTAHVTTLQGRQDDISFRVVIRNT